MNALTTTDNDPREAALLKALGLDKVPPEQRDLALAIARRYDLDPMLRHIQLIDGRPYVTRDGLLWVAHRSGQLDGIEVSEPTIVDKHWHATATVYRKDMSRPFTYPGRYPLNGRNAAYGPEMAIKVAESMALRRAFNIAAPSVDERWTDDLPAEPQEPARSLAERVADRKAAVVAPEPVDVLPIPPTAAAEAGIEQCPSRSPYDADEVQCRREAGHDGLHRSGSKETWQ